METERLIRKELNRYKNEKGDIMDLSTWYKSSILTKQALLDELKQPGSLDEALGRLMNLYIKDFLDFSNIDDTERNRDLIYSVI